MSTLTGVGSRLGVLIPVAEMPVRGGIISFFPGWEVEPTSNLGFPVPTCVFSEAQAPWSLTRSPARWLLDFPGLATSFPGWPELGRRVGSAIVSNTAWRQMWEDSHPRTEEPHVLRSCLDLLLERKNTMVITVTYPRAQDSFRGALHLDLGFPNSLPLLFHLCLSWFGSSWLKQSIWLMRLVYQAQLGLWIASCSSPYPPVNRWLLLGVTPFCWHIRITSHLESVLVAGS